MRTWFNAHPNVALCLVIIAWIGVVTVADDARRHGDWLTFVAGLVCSVFLYGDIRKWWLRT